MTEQLMTYAEWRRYENERQCRQDGHIFEIDTHPFTGSPQRMDCERCGRRWHVEKS